VSATPDDRREHDARVSANFSAVREGIRLCEALMETEV
jgi:hypothetical protein